MVHADRHMCSPPLQPITDCKAKLKGGMSSMDFTVKRTHLTALYHHWCTLNTALQTFDCCTQDQVKDMLAWLELRAAVLMKLERREDAAAVYRSATFQCSPPVRRPA